MAWIYDPSQYEEKDFALIPAGNYRLRIEEVIPKNFKSGNQGFELTLAVSGYRSKIWFNLVLEKSDPKRTNQRIGDLFNSFGITDYNLDHYANWVGKVGGGKVKHEEWNGDTRAVVHYFLSTAKQSELAPWQEPGNSSGAGTQASAGIQPPAFAELPDDSELPFT